MCYVSVNLDVSYQLQERFSINFHVSRQKRTKGTNLVFVNLDFRYHIMFKEIGGFSHIFGGIKSNATQIDLLKKRFKRNNQ